MKGTTKRVQCGERILRDDVKLCGLCSTLNLRSNVECFTCGWHGAFLQDESDINAAWRSLEAEYGSLQREHVSGATLPLLSVFEMVNSAEDPPPSKPWPSRISRWLRSRQ